jgi:hypothetical protein
MLYNRKIDDKYGQFIKMGRNFGLAKWKNLEIFPGNVHYNVCVLILLSSGSDICKM